FAQIGRGVPANIGANPFAAARALMEVWFGLFDRDGEGVVVGLAADGALDFISALPRASQHASEDVPGGAEHVRNDPGGVGLEPRLITVAAFVAAETELKPSVGRKVVEIGGKLDERHEKLLWENYRINWRLAAKRAKQGCRQGSDEDVSRMGRHLSFVI